MTVMAVGVAIAMGCLFAVQPAINGQLRLHVGDPARAALISTSISTLSLLIYTGLTVREPWPDLTRLAAGPWWLWTGGLIGAMLVAGSLVLVVRLGGALFFAALVLGQMLAALAIDHFGLIGVTRQEINPWRAAGAVLVVVGVALIRRH